jgi:5'-nucleotidase
MHTLLWGLLACGPKTTPPSPAPATVHIATLNDWHGALYEQPAYRDPGRAWGGLPWTAAVMGAIRAEHPDLIVLDGGDMFQGAWPVNATRGAAAAEAFALLGVDATAIGNHEFDYGGSDSHPTRGALLDIAAQAPFHWLSANIVGADGQPWTPPGIERTLVMERGGIKLGVIGLSTQETPQTTLAENVADLTFTDPVQAVRDVLPELQAAGVHAIAIVGHLTGSCDPPSYTTPPGSDCMPDGELGRLLTELPPGTIDVIVSGHTHTLLNQRIQDTFVLQSRDRGKMIGRLDLVVTADGVDADASRLLPPVQVLHDVADPGCGEGEYDTSPQEVGGRTIAPDADALALTRRMEAQAGSLCDALGCASAPLTRDFHAESSSGDFVADAMLAAFPGADLAIQNPGGLRANLPKGTIRREHIQQLMPFDNSLYLVEMTGAQLIRLFEIGSSGAHGVLQVSAGTWYHHTEAAVAVRDLNGDGSEEAWEQSRLCALRVGNAPVDPDRRYTVVTTDFLYKGGDHLGPAFRAVPVLQRGPLLRDVLYTAATSPADSCFAVTAPGDRIQVGPCR